MKMITAALVSGIMLAAAPAIAGEIVINGSFSAGAAGFSTDYANLATQPENDATGGIYITTNPATLCGSCFPNMGDHTTGTGNMLFVDGASNANSTIWSETAKVLPNSTYDLSFWTTSLGTAGPQPEVVASLNGTPVVDTGLLPSATGNTATTWRNYTATINSGSATSLTLNFVDPSDTHAFNDLALDDISLTGPAPTSTPVPEPSSLSLLAGGLGLILLGRRRARRTGQMAAGGVGA